MNYRMICQLLCSVMRIVALFMIPAAGISLYHQDMTSMYAFLITMGVMLLISCLTFLWKPRKKAFYAREGFVLAALTWLLVSVFGCLPFVISGAIPDFVDALFETASGFTTTGASIMVDYSRLSEGMIYWRSFTHWLGGMGVLVFLLSLERFSAGSGDSIHIMRAESPGPQVSKLVPHTLGSARILYAIYIAMTVVLFVLLLLGGQGPLEAIATAMGTAGTGGFGITADGMTKQTPYIQWVVGVFMMLFGVNFGIYYLLVQRSWKKALHNEELWVYLGIFVAATAVITYFVYPQYGFADGVRHSFFQVSAIATSTGFASADFNLWPQFARTLLVILMFSGACAGSTGGGFKISRVLILVKSLRQELRRSLHPNTISSVHMDGEKVSKETVTNTYAYLVAYCLILLSGVLLLSFDSFTFEENVTAVISCLNNIGPGLGAVGPMGGYAGFSPFSKIVLTFIMLLGRLEIFPFLTLFVPGVWKKARN